jgi:polyisoprenoid-binding protein YceI
MRPSLVRDLLILIVLVAFGPGGPLVAQPPPHEPGALRVDAAASRVYVKVGAEGYGHAHGVAGRLQSGSITLAPGSTSELVFDMTSFVADTAAARQVLGLAGGVSPSDQRKVTATMLGGGVLDVAHHPRAYFAIAAARPLDGQPAGQAGRYGLDGTFTLHGVSRPLQMIATLEPTDRLDAVRMRGAFAILQSEYGIKPYSALGGIVRVADRLEIQGDLILGAPGR